MSYWWVNHKQTYTSEVEGGYIWSPKENSNGARNQTYINLTLTTPGDIVFSYAAGKIISEIMLLNTNFFKRAIVFRPHNIYGPNMGYNYVIPEIILTTDLIILTKEKFIMLLFSTLMVVAGFFMVKKSPKTIVKMKNIKTIAPSKLIILAEGSLIGLITGLVGAGGGFIIIPVLVILTKLRMKHAIATSLAIISLKSLIGFIGDVEVQIIDWNFLLLFSAISVLGIYVGQYYNNRVPDDQLKKGFGFFVIMLSIIIFITEVI